MEDDECRRLSPRPRLPTQDLAFPVQYRQHGSSNIEATGSHSSLSSHSSDVVLSSTVATQTLEADSSVGCSPILPSRTRERACQILISAPVRNIPGKSLCRHNSLRFNNYAGATQAARGGGGGGGGGGGVRRYTYTCTVKVYVCVCIHIHVALDSSQNDTWLSILLLQV